MTNIELIKLAGVVANLIAKIKGADSVINPERMMSRRAFLQRMSTGIGGQAADIASPLVKAIGKSTVALGASSSIPMSRRGAIKTIGTSALLSSKKRIKRPKRSLLSSLSKNLSGDISLDLSSKMDKSIRGITRLATGTNKPKRYLEMYKAFNKDGLSGAIAARSKSMYPTRNKAMKSMAGNSLLEAVMGVI